MVLGGLIKGLTAAGLNPLPVSPYQGVSYSKLSKALKGMSLPSLCGLHFRTTSSSLRGGCRIQEGLHANVEKVDSILKAVNLEGNYD